MNSHIGEVVWQEFDREFEADVANLTKEHHWYYYDMETSSI